MKLIVTHEKLFNRLTVWFATSVRLVLNLLLAITFAALVIGIVKAGIDLVHAINSPLQKILQDVLLDTVFILALVEIIITLLGYLKDGRVHVRYIVDTILIIMLNEVVSMWFRHPELENAIGLAIIILSLGAVRIGVTKFQPKHDD
jgi:uncharacterized membrane protein (DUF373 family)